MVRRLLTTILALTIFSCIAQTNDSLTYYFDAEWKICDSSEAMYYRKAIWRQDKKLAVRDYYMTENTVQMEGFFLDKSGEVKTDSFIYYSRQGKVSSFGRFIENKKEGKWICFFDNEKTESEGIYNKDKREGKWIFYHENGIVGSVELYVSDSLIKMHCWDENGAPQNVCYEEQMAEFPGGVAAMSEFLSENLSYPPTMREAGITGRVVISFNVDKQGNLNTFIVVKSNYEEFSKEALRVVTKMPNWKPTISHGRLLETNYRLPIVFKLY